MFNAAAAVEALIDDDFTTIIDGGDLGFDYLESILRNGIKGYESMAVSELVFELNSRGIELDQFYPSEVE